MTEIIAGDFATRADKYLDKVQIFSQKIVTLTLSAGPSIARALGRGVFLL